MLTTMVIFVAYGLLRYLVLFHVTLAKHFFQKVYHVTATK